MSCYASSILIDRPTDQQVFMEDNLKIKHYTFCFNAFFRTSHSKVIFIKMCLGVKKIEFYKPQ